MEGVCGRQSGNLTYADSGSVLTCKFVNSLQGIGRRFYLNTDGTTLVDGKKNKNNVVFFLRAWCQQVTGLTGLS